MRFYLLTVGKPKLIGWKFGPFKFGAAKRIKIDPMHSMKAPWGSVVFIIRDKPYSLASVEQMRFDLERVGRPADAFDELQGVVSAAVEEQQTFVDRSDSRKPWPLEDS